MNYLGETLDDITTRQKVLADALKPEALLSGPYLYVAIGLAALAATLIIKKKVAHHGKTR